MEKLRQFTIYALAGIAGLTFVYCMAHGLFGVWEKPELRLKSTLLSAPQPVVLLFVTSTSAALALHAGTRLGIMRGPKDNKFKVQDFACYFYIVVVLVTIVQWGIRWHFVEYAKGTIDMPEFVPTVATTVIGLMTAAIGRIVQNIVVMLRTFFDPSGVND